MGTKSILSFLTIFIFLSGCASYQAGDYAMVVEGNHPNRVPITAEIDTALSTKYYTMINFNFGNLSKDWVRVKSVRLNFKDKKTNEKINIVFGDDLTTWSESISHKMAIDNWNRSVFWGTVGLVGASVAVGSASKGNTSGANAGLAALSVAQGVTAINIVVDQMNALGRSKLFPRTHLYHPFSIPAGLYTKKWVLLQGRKKHIPDNIYFDVEYVNGKKANYKVSLKSGRAAGN